MTVEISCPNCNFSKTIPKEKIPVGVKWATCPRCKNRFEFALPESAFDFEHEQGGTGTESELQRGSSPWEKRSELGIWQGIYQTFKAVLFSPEKLFRTLVFGGGINEPLAFGLLLGSIGTMFGIFWQFLMMWGSITSLSQDLISQDTLNIIFFGIIIISPLFVAIGIFLSSGILHLCLLIVRGGKNGFEGTFRVMAYSQAVQILGLIPFVGGLISWFWRLIVRIIGLREIHETSYLRVIIAFFIPLALILFFVMIVIISLFTLN